MNDLVKNSIDARKNAIFNAYEIKNQSILEKIENLFNRINELGENCIDTIDFETKFANSSLNQEYISLFTEIVNNCEQKIIESEENSNIKTDAEYILDDVVSELKYQADSATMPLRRKARQEAYDKVRDMPVVGEVLNVKQHIDFFSRFRKKKEK